MPFATYNGSKKHRFSPGMEAGKDAAVAAIGDDRDIRGGAGIDLPHQHR